jgi:hypothetical protein
MRRRFWRRGRSRRRGRRSWVKILAFSDTHLDEFAMQEVKDKSSDCDLVVCAGDVSKFSKGLSEAMNEVATIKKEVLLVPGNNDPLKETKELCKKLGITFIHGLTVERSGFNFSGLGAGLPGINSPFELTEEEMQKILSRFKGLKNHVLVSHCPPKGPLGKTMFGTNIGSQSVLEFIEKEQPLLCICGHCHERAGEELVIGETRVINVGKHGITLNL